MSELGTWSLANYTIAGRPVSGKPSSLTLLMVTRNQKMAIAAGEPGIPASYTAGYTAIWQPRVVGRLAGWGGGGEQNGSFTGYC